MANPTAPAKNPAARSTKPGEVAPEAKKPKVERVTYPGLQPGADGKGTVKLKEYPTDHDPKLHKPLRKADFENEAPLMLHQAERLEKQAAKLRSEAAVVGKLGDTASRQKAKKLASCMAQIKALTAQLRTQGVDVDAIIGGLNDATATEQPAQPAA